MGWNTTDTLYKTLMQFGTRVSDSVSLYTRATVATAAQDRREIVAQKEGPASYRAAAGVISQGGFFGFADRIAHASKSSVVVFAKWEKL